MLQIKNLSIMHKKDFRIILRDFSCTFNQGDKVVIIGEEGNGKSTLLRWLCDPMLISAYAEAVGERIIGTERIAFLPQELSKEDMQKSVYEFFSEEPSFFEKTPKELGKMASDFSVSQEVFFSDEIMRTLSGGEKVKVQMMRLLMSNPSVLLLDVNCSTLLKCA